MKKPAIPVQPRPGPTWPVPKPQMTNGELASIIAHNQPWKDRDEIESDVRYEQLRQRLWNGY